MRAILRDLEGYCSPMTLLRGEKPSPQEEFTYKEIDGEWFVLESIWDRVWFDAAVVELN